MNGADVLCDTLLAGDIDVCFANPGTSEMHFVAALDRKPAMRCVLGLFEGVVTGAADGYARMADKPAATLLHLGPGLANGLANLHNARRAGSPVVNIVGDHATYHLPHDAPLTSDIESLAGPMSAWVGRIAASDDVGEQAARAIAASRANGGSVATLILPADAAWGETTRTAPRVPPATHAGLPDDSVLSDVAARLRNGRRTLLLISGKGLRADALAGAGLDEHAVAVLADTSKSLPPVARRFASLIARSAVCGTASSSTSNECPIRVHTAAHCRRGHVALGAGR